MRDDPSSLQAAALVKCPACYLVSYMWPDLSFRLLNSPFSTSE